MMFFPTHNPSLYAILRNVHAISAPFDSNPICVVFAAPHAARSKCVLSLSLLFIANVCSVPTQREFSGVLVTVGVVVLVAIVLVVVTIRDVWFASAPSSDGRFPASSSRKRWRAARSASAHAKTSARARKRIPRFRFDPGARAIIGIGEEAPPHSGAS